MKKIVVTTAQVAVFLHLIDKVEAITRLSTTLSAAAGWGSEDRKAIKELREQLSSKRTIFVPE